MKIIKIMAGLGNQMFQYALYLKFKQLGNKVKIDTEWYLSNKCHNGYELKNIFNLACESATMEEAFYAGSKNSVYRKSNILKKIYYKLFLKNKVYKKDGVKDSITYFPDVFETDCEYIEGYWATEKYFNDIKDVVKAKYTFKDIDVKNINISNNIQRCNSVSIHIRRGDYLKPENSFFVNLSETKYYDKAIQYIKDNIDSPKWFVFSNDMDWCKTNLNITDAVFIDWNIGTDSYRDMQLMSLCKHNIIANSSFSFWGAYLNNNPNKIVIAPSEWYIYKDYSYVEICPEDWVRISCE